MERKIYNINQGVIEVYQFDPNMKELKRFRLQELDKLPVEEQILKREPTRSWFTPKKGVVYECENYILRRYDNPRVSKKDHVDLVREAYIDGLFQQHRVIVHDKLFTLETLTDGDCYINLTEDAYIAYLLENERFTSELLQEANLDNQKGLFTLSDNPIITLSLENMEKIFESGLVSDDYEKTVNTIQSASKVYKKIR